MHHNRLATKNNKMQFHLKGEVRAYSYLPILRATQSLTDCSNTFFMSKNLDMVIIG